LANFRSGSRFPKEVIQKLPILLPLDLVEFGLNEYFSKGQRRVGLGSYTAEIYTLSKGFNQRIPVAEDKDYITRMYQQIQNRENQDGYFLETARSPQITALDDPRRQIAALWMNKGWPYRYQLPE